MAIEKVIDIKVQGNADEAVGSLRSQLRAAQADVAALSEKFGATSQQAVEAAKRAGELKDRIGDAKSLTDAFNPDAKFKSLSSSLSGVAGGFAAVQGGMALFGKQSEDVEKTLLKVQSAMALSQGLQGLGEARDSFKQLKAVAVDAFKGIKSAIGSTGIGLLVVALGTIYAYWDDIKEAVSGVSQEQKKLNAASQKNVDLEAEKLKAISNQDNILKLQGKSEKEILDIKIKQTDEAIIANKINQQNQILNTQLAVQGAKRNYEMLKSYIDFVTIPQRFLYKDAAMSINNIIDLLNKIPGVKIKSKLDETLGDKAADYIAKLGFDPEKVKAEGDKTVKATQETVDKLLNDRAGYQLSKQAIDKEASKTEDEETKKKVKKAEDEAAALKAIEDKKLADDMKSAQDAINILNTLSQNNETPAEKAEREYKDRKAVLEANNLSTEELTRQHLNNLANIELDIAAKKIEKEDSEFLRLQELTLEKADYDKLVLYQKYESEYLAAEGNAELQKQLKIKLDKDIIAVDVATAATQDEIEKKKQQARQVALSAYSSSLKTAASLLGESTDAGKAAAIAATTIDTIQSGVSAFKGMVAAVPGPVGIALGAVAAAGALASGFASVKKIMAVKTPKGGGGGGGGAAPTMSGGGAAGGAAPQFNVVGNSGVNQLAGIMATNEQTPVKAYVVPSDVTTGQSLDRNIIRNASLG
jgi:hypothetical protein